MEIKQIDTAGINFLITEEGIVLQPYADSVGIATIGVGCTYYEDGKRVTLKDPAITHQRAVELFKHVLDSYEKTVWSVTRDDINQNQFNALTSICYNIGTSGFKKSTLLRRVNADLTDQSGITYAFKMWSKQPELLGRRTREAALFFS